MYVRREVSEDDTQRYLYDIHRRIGHSLDDRSGFHPRRSPAATLLNPPIVNYAMQSERFCRADPFEVRERLLESIPTTKLDTTDVEPLDLRWLENGRTPILAMMVAGAVLEEERNALLETLARLSGTDFRKYYDDLHITIARFTRQIEPVALDVGESYLPNKFQLQPVKPLV